MAVTETVKIVFEADTGGVTDSINELVKLKKITQEEADALKKLAEEAKKTDDALGGLGDELDDLIKDLPKVNDGADNAGKNFVNLRTQVKQAKEEVQRMTAEFGEFSAEANAARVKAGALADQMSDLNRQVNLLNPEAKAKAFVNFGNQIVGAFQIATGALQAFGAENEQVAKLAMRLQGALNVAQGIASLKSLKEGYQDLKVVLGFTTVAQNSLNQSQVAGAAATSGLGKAFKALWLAISANPLIAVASAIGALAGAYFLLRDNAEKATQETDEFLAKQKALASVTEELVRAEEDLAIAKDPSRKAEILKARAARDTNDALKDQVKENEEINKKIAENNRLNDDAAKRIEILKKSNREAAIFQIQGLQQAIDKRTKENQSLTKTRDLNQDIINESNKLLATKQKQLDIENKIEKSTQKQAEAKAISVRFGNIDLQLDTQNLDQAAQDLATQISESLNDISVQLPKVKGADFADDLSDFFKKEDDLRQKRIDNINQSVDLFQDAFSIYTEGIQNQYAEEADALEQSRERGLITEEQYQTKLKAIKRKAAEDQKKAQIFQATLNAAQGVLSASAGFYLTPAERTTAIAFAIATGALNLAKIIATPLPKFKKGTLSVPGVDTGQDSVLAMLRPGEAVIPTETNREYAPVMRAIYRREINAKELNDFVTNREQGGFAFNQVSLDALYKRDLKVSAITQAGRSAQLTAQPTKITADVDVQQLSKAISKNKGVEVTNAPIIARALAQELAKTNNLRRQ